MEAIAAGTEIEKVLLQTRNESNSNQELFRLIRDKNLSYQFVPLQKLNLITRKNHQGVIAFISQVSYTPLEEVVAACYEKGRDPFIIILDHISDVRNFGAIARTAECAGADAIVIPSKGSVRISADAVKTSAGALLTIPVSRVSSLPESVVFLREAGLRIIAATEKTKNEIYDRDLTGPVALILGSEDTGISSGLIELCDEKVRIPLFGKIESLNVSVAAAILIYETVRQRIKAGA